MARRIMNGNAEKTGEEVVRMKGVEVTYTSKPKLVFKGGFQLQRKSVTVFEDIDLGIRKGEFATIVGPSGCGKSTLFRLILGSQFPTRGEVSVKGAPVKHVTPLTGIVYQRYSLFPHLTVADNIALGPLLQHTGAMESIIRSLGPRYRRVKREARDEAFGLLSHVGMKEDDGNKFPHELSGGMQQRVAIAQATIMKPEVLLMDEPFGALDHSTREDMQLFIREQAREHNLTVIFVTHDLDEALFLGSRILGLSQYWKAEEGKNPPSARIVTDRNLNAVLGEAGSRDAGIIDAPEFRALRRKVHQDVLDATHLQTADQFDIDPRP
jgi:NitT/TauT family transport system ATP-binding protein